jgi:hypothetical protein
MHLTMDATHSQYSWNSLTDDEFKQPFLWGWTRNDDTFKDASKRIRWKKLGDAVSQREAVRIKNNSLR